MKLNKFIEKRGDYDGRIAEKEIIVRLTPLRYKLLTKSVKNWNYNHKYPYGISPNGYAYRCGCEHDCCGCLVGESVDVEFNQMVNDWYFVKLTYSASYNY